MTPAPTIMASYFFVMIKTPSLSISDLGFGIADLNPYIAKLLH